MRTTTRYGAAIEPLTQASAVLRARVIRHGGTLAVFDPTRAAAAVVAVEAWMAALGEDELDGPQRHGPAGVAALTAAFELLCSDTTVPDPPDMVLSWVPAASVFVVADELRHLVESWGLDPTEVLAAASGALSRGGDDPRLAAMSAVLAVAATP
jgi:hypothetical protein